MIVSLTLFINKPDSSRDLIIFMLSSVSPFEIIHLVKPETKSSFGIAAFIADVDAVNSNIITLLKHI